MAQGPPSELDSRPQGRREWSGWLTSLVLPISFVVVLVGGLVYIQSRPGEGDDGSPYGAVALPAGKNATGQAPAPVSGRAAPDFVLESTSAGVIHLSDMQGRPVLITFFATWCSGCRSQLPLLIAAQDGASADLLILAVNLREAEDRIDAFLAGYGAKFDVLLDRTGEVASIWRVGGRGQPLPATFFIDAAGVIRKVVEGPLSAPEMSEGLSLIAGGKH